MRRGLQKSDLVYPDLCYKIVGSLFKVWTDLGPGHKEKLYQKALAEEFKKVGLEFRKELPVKLVYAGKPIGIYYFDFLVEEKVVLELKVRNYFSSKDIKQVFSYLKSQNLRLGIIAHFMRSGVKFKRIVNTV